MARFDRTPGHRARRRKRRRRPTVRRRSGTWTGHRAAKGSNTPDLLSPRIDVMLRPYTFNWKCERADGSAAEARSGRLLSEVSRFIQRRQGAPAPLALSVFHA